LTAAVIAVLGALKNDPEKQLVIYDLFYNNNNCYPSNNNDDSILYTISKIMSSSAANPENYLPSFVHRKVFELSEKFYDSCCLQYDISFRINFRPIRDLTL
jgi:hypothetical protein